MEKLVEWYRWIYDTLEEIHAEPTVSTAERRLIRGNYFEGKKSMDSTIQQR